MLLSPISIFELLITVETEMAKLDALGNVSKKTFKVDEALDVEYCEVVLQPHVVEILLDALGLMVAEEADSEGL